MVRSIDLNFDFGFELIEKNQNNSDKDGKQELIVGTSEKTVIVICFNGNELAIKKSWKIPDEIVSLSISHKSSDCDVMIIAGLLRGSVAYISYTEGMFDLELCQERFEQSRHDDPVVVTGPIKINNNHQSPLNSSASIDG